MGQIAQVSVETPNGTVNIPVFAEGDSGGTVYEMVKVETPSGIGFIPTVENSGTATYPYLKVQTANHGIVHFHDKAALATVLEDFEDGDISIANSDWSGWSGDTGTFTAQTSTVISGTYSGDLEVSGSGKIIDATRSSPTTDDVELKLRFSDQSSNTSDDSSITFRSGGSTGTRLGSLEILDGGEWYWQNGGTDPQVISSWSANTTYTVRFNWDFANDTVDIVVDGTTELTDAALENSLSDYDNIRIKNTTFNSGITRSLFLDDLLLFK